MGLFKEANWQKKNKKKKHQTSRMLKCFVLKKKYIYIKKIMTFTSVKKYLITPLTNTSERELAQFTLASVTNTEVAGNLKTQQVTNHCL